MKKRFRKIHRKDMCWSLFFNKVATLLTIVTARILGKLPPNPKTKPNLNPHPKPNRGKFSSGAIARIPTERTVFTQFNTRIYWNISLSVSDHVPMFTQSINFYTFYHHMLKSTEAWKMEKNGKKMEKNGKKVNVCSFQLFSKVYGKIWVGFCLNTGKYFFLDILF